MAITLIERPYRLGFSRNESRYIFTVTNPASAGCAVQVRLFCHTITSAAAPPELITDIKLVPNPDGQVTFYAQTYFESILKLQMPSPGDNAIVPAVNQQRYYWIEYRQVTDLAPNNAWIITERDRKRVMLLGGIEVQKYERNNFFDNYLIPQKWWLTWLPSSDEEGYRFVGIAQEHYLTWLRTYTEAFVPKLYVEVFYTDGTTDDTAIDIDDPDKSLIFHLPAGVAQLDLLSLQPTKTIHYYELRVQDDTEGVLADPYRFYVDYDHYYKKFDWVYLNSISGLDAVCVHGRYTRDIDREVSSASKLNLITNINDEIKNSDTIDTGILLTKKWKGDVGWMNSAYEQDAVADLLATTELFENVDDRWLRIRLLSKTQPMGGSEDKKWSFPAEFVYAWVNSSYTPDKKLFGAGSNTGEVYDATVSACPNPTGLAAVFNADIAGQDEIKFSWTHPGNIEAIIEVKEDGTDTWVAYTGDLTGINEAYALFVADGRTMNWRLKVKCPNDDSSAYVNGPNFVLTDNASACALPTALTWTMGTPSAGLIPFTFEWAHAVPAPNFTLQYREVGTSVWTDVAVAAAVTTTIDFADDGKTYEWRVKALCDVGSESPYVNGSNFVASSAITCTAPYSLYMEVVDSTDDDVLFIFAWVHPGAINYLLQIRRGDGPWVDYTTLTTWREVTIDKNMDLYHWRVAAECTAGNFSSFTYGDSFGIIP